MVKTIRVSVNEDVERLLEAMKLEYPALDYAEILKLGLSELYRKHELAARQIWRDSLPELELTDEEAQDIAEARKEKGRIMSVDEIMAEALSN
ncbi:hypothetical protein BH24DEI2_BH24DEI2_11190 [soil metagenome]